MNALKRLIRRTVVPASAAATAGTEVSSLGLTNALQRYYVNGFLEGRFAPTSSRARLLHELELLRAGTLRPGFHFQEKYPHTRDLRPSAASYDASILDVIFDSDVPRLLADVTGQRLDLVHVQVRIVYPGASYMDWHRDTHHYGGQLVGNIPPLQKVIYYPAFGERPTPQLRVSPGSHRRTMQEEKRDLQQVKETPAVTISSGDDRFLLFDTSLLHAVVPETDARGSLRVIYAFGHSFQCEPYAASRDVQERYRARVNAL